MKQVMIIAEAGVNHNGSLDMAMQLIDAAADAGVDYVKFQTFKADKLVSRDTGMADYQKSNTGTDTSQYEMLRKLELSAAHHEVLIDYCNQKNVQFLSTAFDLESIDLLVSLGITLGKVPSGEITNKPYLEKMARSFERIILSTGMCTMDEIMEAIQVLEANGKRREDITVLHCNTEYPTPMHDVNLKAMHHIARVCGTAIGYSDHTLGIEVPIAAVALGASVIEKHFTLDCTLPGPDHRASLEPSALKAMVDSIRNIEQAMAGDGIKHPSTSEMKNITVARKSIHLAKDCEAGHVLTESDFMMMRPGDGISPMRMDEVIGRCVKTELTSGKKLTWEDLV
ncbi:MAG: N-acetylneuraminate synthase [Flavobacteriales bacterium]|jgi:N,N'-diacetyllegionaminate synthase